MQRQQKLLVILVSLLLLTVFLFRVFLSYAEDRACLPFTDFLHVHFTAIDFSYLIFALTWLPLVLFVLLHRKNTERLNNFALGYIFVLLTRMVSIYVFPFCAPAGAIQLGDGVLSSLFYPNGYSALDLMYSGHTATLFLVTLCCYQRVRLWLWCPCLAVASMLVLQKVHYTVDVLVAFPVTWLCYYSARKIIGNLGFEV